jgi:hypothetical protein
VSQVLDLQGLNYTLLVRAIAIYIKTRRLPRMKVWKKERKEYNYFRKDEYYLIIHTQNINFNITEIGYSKPLMCMGYLIHRYNEIRKQL